MNYLPHLIQSLIQLIQKQEQALELRVYFINSSGRCVVIRAF